MDGGSWQAAVQGVAKSRTWLNNFTFTFHFHALEKKMATHSSVVAWRIPAMGEPGGLPSMGSHRVGHDWSDLAASPSHSIVFLYFFALITEEGFLISPCYSLELCIQFGLSFPFFLACFSSFLSYLKSLIRPPLCLLAFLFLWDGFGHHLLYNVMNLHHCSSGTLSTRSNPLNLFVISTV